MSFAAVNFLKREIEDLLTSHGNSLAAPSREILQFAITEMDSLQQITKRLIPWSRTDTTFRYQVSRLNNEVKQIAEQSEEQIIHKIHQGLVQLKTMGEKYVQQLYISSPKEDEEDEGDVHCAEKMVGLVYEFNKLKHRLRISWLKSTQVTALVGMTGIGKTTLAGKLLEDPQTEEHFDCRVWVTVGKECRFKEIPRRILAAEADLHSLMGDPWNPQQFALLLYYTYAYITK